VPGIFVCQPSEGVPSQTEVYTITEEMPEFPGGVKEMMSFLQKNITYPASCRKNNLGGKVFIKFIINTEGNLTDATVIKGTGLSDLDNEALRVVKMMPKWKPGKQDGKAVNVYFNLPVNFDIGVPYYMFNTKNTKYQKHKPCLFGIKSFVGKR
jgi:periplasmic protein TonB